MLDRIPECSPIRLYYCVPELCEQCAYHGTIQMLLKMNTIGEPPSKCNLTNTDCSSNLLFFIVVADDLPKWKYFLYFPL